MNFIVVILTFLLIVNCGVLALLILVQLPKKDAGAGLAFGGGTADALFGAGSGNALTKITKWATASFIILAIFLGALETKLVRGNQSQFEQGVEQQQQTQSRPQSQFTQPQTPAPTPASSPVATPTPGAVPVVPATNNLALPASTNGK